MPPESALVAPAAIAAVDAQIRPYIRRTPILDVDGATLKLEYMQHGGSFKARGAFSNLLTREMPAAGVVAASGGNHGVAVAYAAMRLRVPCAIFVPTVAAQAKIDLIRSYGARLVVRGERYSESYEASLEYEQKTGALGIHAFDSVQTLLGAGTVALEFEQQAQVDTLLVAVGGGGLIGGIASWYEGRIRIVGVEPEGSPTMHDALAAGYPVDASVEGIASDSLAPRRVGDLTYAIAARHVERVVLVTDADIVASRSALWERARVAVEPGGAAAYAALLSGKYQAEKDERVGIVVCGANAVLTWSAG